MGQSSYKRLGDYIEAIDERNSDLSITLSQGISNNKCFQEPKQVATNSVNDKIVRTGYFAYNRATTRNGEKISIALREGDDCTVSSAYQVFRVLDEDVLLSKYLLLWFQRPVFDRYARFKSHGSAHEFFDWEEMCEVRLPIPDIEEQREIVAQYEAITRRIALNERICANLEETAQALYNKMFVQDIDPDNLPDGWRVGTLDEIAKIVMGQSPDGSTYNELGEGVIFFQGRTDFGFRFPSIRMYTTQPTRMALENDILISVRAPVGDLNISLYKCCIGRGLASIRSKESNTSFLLYTLKYYEGYFSSLNDDGTIFGSINKETLSGMPIVIPTEGLVKEFERTAKAIDSKIKNALMTNRILDNIKGLLLSKL